MSEEFENSSLKFPDSEGTGLDGGERSCSFSCETCDDGCDTPCVSCTNGCKDGCQCTSK